MNIEEFTLSVHIKEPPEDLSSELLSLWFDAKGIWDEAHEIANDINSKDGAWIHAYLHRKEGDIWNADYWYRRAGKSRPSFSLQEEWENLVQHFLQSQSKGES